MAPVIAVGCLVVLTTLVFARHLFESWTFPWDFLGTYTATPPFVAATVGHGHVASWTPFVASGFPADVNPQAGMYYPVWWVAGVLGVPLTLQALTDVQVLHVLFGALGVLLLARARRLAWPWATAASVAYVLFGAYYGQAEHADMFRGFAYLPWVMWALTPPAAERRWTRLMALPLVTWLVATGAYPGQLVSFAIIALVYGGFSLWSAGPSVWRRNRLPLLLAVVASGAICVAVLLPYLRADRAHQLYRAFPPTAAGRASESLSPLDLLGLYLNNWAWRYDGSVTTWGLAIPILVGLAFVRSDNLRRHAPLAAAGVTGLALAMTPKIGPIGKAMVALGPLFPSRFPAPDYKAAAAIAIVVLSAEAWGSHLAGDRRRLPWAPIAVGCALALGALLAPATYGPITRTPWLLGAMVAATLALSVARPAPRLLVCLLVPLIAIDGVREIRDYRLKGSISSWRVQPSAVVRYRARDQYVRKLPTLLAQAPATRPARVPPWAPLPDFPTGNPPDAAGWVAQGYHLIDYGGTIERPLHRVEVNPKLVKLMQLPWHSYVFPCAAGGCQPKADLPDPASWRPSPAVRTLSYGRQRIVYQVSLPSPAVMVENELAISGWQSNDRRVQPASAGLPLRTWRLPAGNYRFTTTYNEPGRLTQALAAVAGLLCWLGCVFLLRRRRLDLPRPRTA
jgi:hypothetical protein